MSYATCFFGNCGKTYNHKLEVQLFNHKIWHVNCILFSHKIKGGIFMKKWFEKLLKKIEEANKENFGSGRMDCCDVNQKSNNHGKKK